MAEQKAIVHNISAEDAKKSIETMKVRKETMEYLRKNGYKTIEDVIKKQDKLPSGIKGNIYAYLIFGMED